MSHPQQINYIKLVKNQFQSNFINSKILEIGSLDINGSIRQFFESCDYTGIDLGEGKGVDIVCEGQHYDAPADYYDTVVSCECFEHNPYWIETFNNMIRVCKPGGLIIMTCATTGRKEHGTTRTSPKDSPLTIGKGWDYYKNLTRDDFLENIAFDDFFKTCEFSEDVSSCDLYFWGIKK